MPQNGEPLGGVDRSTGVGKIDQTSIGGQLVEALGGRIGALALPDDSQKPYIVVVGSKEFQASALEALNNVKAKEVAHVVAYTEDQWHAKGVGYTEGVWFTAPRGVNGKAFVYAYEQELKGKEGPLKSFIEAIRKPDGILDKKLIPALRKAVDPSPYVWDKAKTFIGPVAMGSACLLLLGAFLKP